MQRTLGQLGLRRPGSLGRSRLRRGSPTGPPSFPLAAADLNFTRAKGTRSRPRAPRRSRVHDVDSLLGITEGWSTAVALGVKAAMREREFAEVERRRTLVLVYAYLAEQVYGALSEEQRSIPARDRRVPGRRPRASSDMAGEERRAMLAELRKQAPVHHRRGAGTVSLSRSLPRVSARTSCSAAGAGVARGGVPFGCGRAGKRRPWLAEAILLVPVLPETDTVRSPAATRTGPRPSSSTARPTSSTAVCARSAIFAGDAALLALRASVDALSADFGASESALPGGAAARCRATTWAEIAYRFATDLLKRGKSEALDVLRTAAVESDRARLCRPSIHGTLATAFALHNDAASARTHIEVALAVADSGGSTRQRARPCCTRPAMSPTSAPTRRRAWRMPTRRRTSPPRRRCMRSRLASTGSSTAPRPGFLDDRVQGAVLLAQMPDVARQVGDVYLTLWALAGFVRRSRPSAATNCVDGSPRRRDRRLRRVRAARVRRRARFGARAALGLERRLRQRRRTPARHRDRAA